MARALKPPRLLAIDAARGIAMLFVCFSHFGFVYFRELPAHAFELALVQRLSMLATPTFITISGLLLGFLYRTRPEGWAALRAKLLDRGLFMLTIGRLLIVLAHAPVTGGIESAFEWGFITDVIGLGVIVGPPLVERLRPVSRVALAGGLYAVAWAAVIEWHPETAGVERLKEYVVGPAHFLLEHPRLVAECFPLAPWLALYIAATALGDYLGGLSGERRWAVGRVTLGRLAAASLLVALAVKGVPTALEMTGLAQPGILAWTLGWPFQKQPPSPAYLGLYVGLGLLLLRATLAIEERPAFSRWLTVPAALGRSSLAVFIVQYYVYFTVMQWWRPAFSPLWPLLFPVSLVLVVAIGLAWDRSGNNDVFGVGYRLLSENVARAPSVDALHAERQPSPLDRHPLQE